MLAWLGLSAVWLKRSFWTAANLMASAFYGDRALGFGFDGKTVSGLALYLVVYSTLGALIAMLIGDRLTRRRVLLMSVAAALAWYYLSFQLLWKSVMPLVALLHAVRPTLAGHAVYGLFLGRYPAYLPPHQPPPEPEPPTLPAGEAEGAESPAPLAGEAEGAESPAPPTHSSTES